MKCPSHSSLPNVKRLLHSIGVLKFLVPTLRICILDLIRRQHVFEKSLQPASITFNDFPSDYSLALKTSFDKKPTLIYDDRSTSFPALQPN